MARTQQLGFSLSQTLPDGSNIFHWSAGNRGRLGAQSAFFYWLSKVEPEVAVQLLRGRNLNQLSALDFAIQNKNSEVALWLIQQGHVDPQGVNTERLNSLDLSDRYGLTEVSTKLREVGYQLTTFPRSCRSSNNWIRTMNDLEQLMEYCGTRVRNADDLLSLLPDSMKSNYILIFGGRGIQKGNLKVPRIVMFHPEGNLYASLTGHHKMKGGKSIEFLSFNSTTPTPGGLQENSFVLREATPKRGSMRWGQKNPTECLACHGNNPRPLWTNWSSWTGVYFGDMSAQYKEEKVHYERFLQKARTYPRSRYVHLLPQSQLGHVIKGTWRTGNPSGMEGALSKLDALIDDKNALNVSSQVAKNPSNKKYRYAILGALICQNPISDFLPVAMFSQDALNSITRSTIERNRESQQEDNELQKRFLRSGFVGRYNREQLMAENYFAPSYGNNFETERVPKLRYLFEHVIGDNSFRDWSIYFKTVGPSYTFATLSNIEAEMWRTLLHPEVDRDLITLLDPVYQRAKTLPRIFSFLFNTRTETQTTICAALKTRSLEELERQAGRRLIDE